MDPTTLGLLAKEPSLTEVLNVLKGIEADMTVLKQGQSDMKTDIQSIKREHSDLKKKIGEFKDSLDYAHGEITDLKAASRGHESSINKLITDSGELGNKFNEMNSRLRRTEARVSGLSNDTSNLQDQINVLDPTASVTHEFPIDRTVVVYNVPYDRDEIVFELAVEIVSQILGLELVIVRALRKGAGNGKCGIIKIELESEHDMIQVLKAKRNLRWHSNSVVRKFFIRQSQSDETRRTRRCLDGFLKHIDPERTLMFNAKGELVENHRRGRGSSRGISRGNLMSTRVNQHTRFDSDDEEYPALNSGRGYGRGMSNGRGRGTHNGNWSGSYDDSNWMSSSGRGNRPPGNGYHVTDGARASSTGVAGSGRGNRAPGYSNHDGRGRSSGRGHRAPGIALSGDQSDHAGRNGNVATRAGTTGDASSGRGHSPPGSDRRDHVGRGGDMFARAGTNGDAGSGLGHRALDDENGTPDESRASGRGHRAPGANDPGSVLARASTIGDAGSGRGNSPPGTSPGNAVRPPSGDDERNPAAGQGGRVGSSETSNNDSSIFADADNDNTTPVARRQSGGDSFTSGEYY